MCKLLIITGRIGQRSLGKALLAASDEFVRTEKDGFGFIATRRGRYARGRYLSPERFRGFGLQLPDWIGGQYAEENKLAPYADSVIMHGRTATSAINLGNVHPFMRGHEALAHNGIVNWIGEKAKEPKFDCDSEQLFDWLQSHDWHESRQAFAGSGAIAHVDVKSGMLTIARDGCTLYIAQRVRKQGWVMATKEETLVKVCKQAGIGLSMKPLMVPNMKLLTFNGRGQAVGAQDWKGFGVRRFTTLDNRSWRTEALANAETRQQLLDYNHEELLTTTLDEGQTDHLGKTGWQSGGSDPAPSGKHPYLRKWKQGKASY